MNSASTPAVETLAMHGPGQWEAQQVSFPRRNTLPRRWSRDHGAHSHGLHGHGLLGNHPTHEPSSMHKGSASDISESGSGVNFDMDEKLYNSKAAKSATEGNAVREHSLESVGVHAWAGAVAGMIAETCMHPLDTISTRLKVQGADVANHSYHGVFGTARIMIAEEGVGSLFRGVSATLIGAMPSSALYFAVYETSKHYGMEHMRELTAASNVDNGGELTEWQEDLVHLGAGVVSELGSSFIWVPFEVIKSRLQTSSPGYTGTVSGLMHIARSEGISGLFAGYRACLLLDCTASGLQFLFYERIRRELKRRREEKHKIQQQQELLSPLGPPEQSLLSFMAPTNLPDMGDLRESVEETAEDLVAGACSGGLAAFLSNPLDVVSVRLMTQREDLEASAHRRFHYKGTFDCLFSVARNEGIRGLWSGSVARTLSVLPLSAIQFAIYEKMKSFLGDSV